jgi:hypothetical protein
MSATIGSATLRVNLDVVLPVAEKMVYHPRIVDAIRLLGNSLASGPLLNVSLISVKSLPLVLFGDSKLVKEFDNGLACRMSYLESSVLSTVGAVYHFATALIFSIATVFTGGAINSLRHQMDKEWTRFALSILSLGISAAGTVSPEWGIRANAVGLAIVGVGEGLWVHDGVIERIVAGYLAHKEDLKRSLNDPRFDPFCNYLDQHLLGFKGNVLQLLTILEAAYALLPKGNYEYAYESTNRYLNVVFSRLLDLADPIMPRF